MTDWASVRYAVVDVEGNGQQPPDLVELAVVPIVGGIIGHPASWLVKPTRPIKPHGHPHPRPDQPGHCGSTSLRRHRGRDTAGTGCRRSGGPQCARRYRCAPAAIWADGSAPRSSTRSSSRGGCFPGRESYKLGALVTAFALADCLPAGLTPHRATYDALVTARLFVHLATRQDLRPLSPGELRDDEREETVMLRPSSSQQRGLFISVDGPAAPGSPPSSPTSPRCSWPQANRCTSPPNHRMARSGCCAAS